MGGFFRGVMLGVMGLLIAIQAIRPARTNPPVDEARTLGAAVAVPPAVDTIIARSCDDCHSDRTRWPWYSNVAPASWFVANHVEEGRRHMNFSEWLRPGIADPMQYTRQKFYSVCERVQDRDMPLFSYVLLHPRARLSPADVQALCAWADDLNSQDLHPR